MDVSDVAEPSLTVEDIPVQYKEFADVFDITQEETLPKYREDLAMDLELLPGETHTTSCQYKLTTAEYEALKKN